MIDTLIVICVLWPVGWLLLWFGTIQPLITPVSLNTDDVLPTD